MKTKEKHACCGTTFVQFWTRPCGINASIERDGKWYCKKHDPVSIKEKQADKNKKWSEEYEARKAESAKKQALVAETQRRADCFDDLLDALKSLVANLFEGDFISETRIDAARAAIAKATGEAMKGDKQ